MGFEDLEIDSLTCPLVPQEVFAPLCVSASPSLKAPGVMYVRESKVDCGPRGPQSWSDCYTRLIL